MFSLLRKIPVNHLKTTIRRAKSNKKCPAQKKQDYIIVRAKIEDYEKILTLMRRAYYSEEPTTSSIGFQVNSTFEDRTYAGLAQGFSLIARCKYNGDIIGASINEASHAWDPDEMDRMACLVQCPKSRQLLHFYAHMQRLPNLWQKYGVQSVFEIVHLFIKRTERKKGIALKLMEDSREVGADCGFPLVRVDATSHYTAIMCEKLKMKMVSEIPYCSYVGEDMRPIFNPPSPHNSVKVYVDDDPQTNALSYQKEKKKKKN